MAEAGTWVLEKLRCPGGYLAVHVRPYPDSCLALWQRLHNESREAEPHEWKQHCVSSWGSGTPDLWANFPRQVAAHLDRSGVQCLYLMAHPHVMGAVRARLRQQLPSSVRVVHYSAAVLQENLGASDMLRLSFLEEEICARATWFMGTFSSSMTGLIVQERLVQGRGPTTLAFVEDDSRHPPLASGMMRSELSHEALQRQWAARTSSSRASRARSQEPRVESEVLTPE